MLLYVLNLGRQYAKSCIKEIFKQNLFSNEDETLNALDW